MGAKLNLRTGKIIGARKNSFGWWHEKGHLVYDNSEEGIKNSYNQEMSFKYAVLFCIISFFFNSSKYFAMIMILIYFGYYFFEEHWCNKYAKNKLEESNNGN